MRIYFTTQGGCIMCRSCKKKISFQIFVHSVTNIQADFFFFFKETFLLFYLFDGNIHPSQIFTYILAIQCAVHTLTKGNWLFEICIWIGGAELATWILLVNVSEQSYYTTPNICQMNVVVCGLEHQMAKYSARQTMSINTLNTPSHLLLPPKDLRPSKTFLSFMTFINYDF